MSEKPAVLEFIDSPAVWYGEELVARSDWLHTLSEDDVDELARANDDLADVELEAINRELFALPGLSRRLAEIQNSLETGSGATMIRGFPTESFTEAQSTRIFWGIAQHIGTPCFTERDRRACLSRA